jgi:hypothetical protein
MSDKDLPTPIQDDTPPFPPGLDPLEQAIGMPLPEELKKNFWRATGRGVGMPIIAAGAGAAKIITELAAVITAPVKLVRVAIEERTRAIEARAAARETAIEGAGKAAAASVGVNPAVAMRALDRLAGDLVREQSNRDQIARLAFQQIKGVASATPIDSPSAIDDDWLTQFWRTAETKSSQEFQLLFARILAGEVRKPGSFSPAALHALSTLSPITAGEFQALCNASYCAENTGVFALEWALPDRTKRNKWLMELQALRLIAVEGEHGINAEDIAQAKGNYAGAPFYGEDDPTPPKPDRNGPRCTYFLEAGEQVRTLLDLKPDWDAARRARSRLLETWGVRLHFPGSPIESEPVSPPLDAH